MKTFKSYLKEQGMGVGPSHSGSAMDADVNIAALGDPAVVKRLNAMVGQIGNMEYLIPEHALNRLRNNLNKIGLTFGEIPTMEGKSGSFYLPFARFGVDLEKTKIHQLMNL